MLFGSLSGELEVHAPAGTVWELYGSVELAAVHYKALPDVFEKFELVEGDGSVGSIWHVVFRPGLPFPSFKEKMTTIDDEKRMKDSLIIEGGYLGLGFERCVLRWEVIEKDEKSCITRSTIEYEVKEEFAANASLVSIYPLMVGMSIANTYLLSKTN